MKYQLSNAKPSSVNKTNKFFHILLKTMQLKQTFIHFYQQAKTCTQTPVIDIKGNGILLPGTCIINDYTALFKHHNSKQ